ncbi:lipopolysaccharide transport periplasmic protein LptA [Sulfurimonas sp.]|nr:lipopolysaccharide transport periplasmic protein LptA [Sulfurimonas sp.]
MKKILIIALVTVVSLCAQELKVKSKTFSTDQNTGVSVFEGLVNVRKGTDELNASKVTIYTDSEQQPTKFVADGDASFSLKTLEGDVYQGTAQKVVYLTKKKEYRFYVDVHLNQINDKKEIIGEEVVLKTIEGKAYAKGANEEPVIMIFNLPKKK